MIPERDMDAGLTADIDAKLAARLEGATVDGLDDFDDSGFAFKLITDAGFKAAMQAAGSDEQEVFQYVKQAVLKMRIVGVQGHDGAKAPPLIELFRALHVELADAGQKEHTINSEIINMIIDKVTEDYKIDRKMLDKLHAIVAEAADPDYGPARFVHNYMGHAYEFAYVKGQGNKKQYDGWVYDHEDCKWREDVEHYIMERCHHMDGTPMTPDLCFKNSSKVAAEGARQILTDKDISLKLELDADYRQKRALMVIDPYGNYYDIPTGTVRKIDPSQHFFERQDVAFELDADLPEPEHWLKHLEQRVGAEGAARQDDHLAGSFLPANILGSKPHMMITIGPTDTYKSMPHVMMKKILAELKIRNVSLRDLARDTFAGARMAGAQINWIDELPTRGRALDTLKDMITSEGIAVRAMNTTKDKDIVPPRLQASGNTMPTVVESGEDIASIMNRLIINETKPVAAEEPKWRELILNDSGELRRIMMHLLRRCTEIYKNPDCIRTQAVAETVDNYERLRSGNLKGIIAEHCIEAEDATQGVSLAALQSLFTKTTKRRISKAAFVELLNDNGFPEADTTRKHCLKIEGRKDSYQINSMADTGPALVPGILFMTPDEKRSAKNAKIDALG